MPRIVNGAAADVDDAGPILVSGQYRIIEE
jgi:hypothetical protein